MADRELTPNQVFLNALRGALDLDPLYGVGDRSDRDRHCGSVRASSAWDNVGSLGDGNYRVAAGQNLWRRWSRA